MSGYVRPWSCDCQNQLVCAPVPAGPVITALPSLSTAMSGSPAPRTGSTTVGTPTAKHGDASADGTARYATGTSTTAAAPILQPLPRPLKSLIREISAATDPE